MKKTLGIITAITILASLAACANKPDVAQTSAKTALAGSLYVEDAPDDEFFAYYDLVHIDFDEAVSGCYAVVCAQCNGLVSSDEESRIYEFTLENVINGGEMPSSFRVAMPKGSFTCEDGAVFTSNDMRYKTGESYFLPLKKEISVFRDYDLYYPAAQIFAELDENGGFVEPKIQGRTLTEAKSTQDFAELAQKQRLVCSQTESEIGTPFSRSDDLSEIISETEYILEVHIDSVEYNGAGDRTTYKCSVIDRLKTESDKDAWINAVLPKDCAEVGGKYLLLLNRCGENSYLFTISSRNYSIYHADSTQAKEITDMLG